MGAHYRTEMLPIARSAAHNPSTSRIESETALNPSLLQKKVHPPWLKEVWKKSRKFLFPKHSTNFAPWSGGPPGFQPH